jgi:lipid-binding SYLF domain-containing protein
MIVVGFAKVVMRLGVHLSRFSIEFVNTMCFRHKITHLNQVQQVILVTMTDAKKPAGTTMEGMIWNANHVLDMALSPRTKKSKDILKDAIAVVILESEDVGLFLAGSRGSGVLMVKHGDDWSAPSAITLSAMTLGWTLGVDHKGLMIVFVADGTKIDGEQTLYHILNGLTSPAGIGFSKPPEKVIVEGDAIQQRVRDDHGAFNAYLTTNGEDLCYVYTYTDMPQFLGRSLAGTAIRHHAMANERFYGKKVSPHDIVKSGYVTVPEGSGIPDLQNKLKALESGTDVTLTPQAEKSKEVLRKKAVEAGKVAEAEMPEEIEEYTA